MAAVATLVLGGSAYAMRRQDLSFPHAKHAKLFPTCVGCHVGVPTGDAANVLPSQESCSTCHDGLQQKKVTFSPVTRSPRNLHFDHAEHAKKVPAAQAECVACHATPGAPFMAARRALPEQCQSCHEHQATTHFADDNNCLACHVKLTEATAMPTARLAALPKPASHARADFSQAHSVDAAAAGQRCAVCHTRESCERCHANAGSVAAITTLGRDARVARLASLWPAKYGTPPSHMKNGFVVQHGKLAESLNASCANCHTQPSCNTCHTGPLGRRVIDQLPLPVPGGARGVRLERWSLWSAAAVPTPGVRYLLAARGDTTPAGTATPSAGDTTPRRVRPHPRNFAMVHGAEAASGQVNCAGCHVQQQFCSDCHAGNEGRRRFHAPNFAARHAPDAFGREKDCASCHNPELFCRSCHSAAGLASGKGFRQVAYHTAQPLWLLQHGRAARQSLQSCTTCHTQVDCMACHAAGTGWKVNPHGRDFDAAKMYQANRLVCLRCHPTDPMSGR
jgi:hypothetical protein